MLTSRRTRRSSARRRSDQRRPLDVAAISVAAAVVRVGAPLDEAVLLEEVDGPARGRGGRVHPRREVAEPERADRGDLDQPEPLRRRHRLGVVLDPARDPQDDRVQLPDLVEQCLRAGVG